MSQDSDMVGLHEASLATLAAAAGVLVAAGFVAASSFGTPQTDTPPEHPLPGNFAVRLAEGGTRGKSWFEGRAWVVNLWSPS